MIQLLQEMIAQLNVSSWKQSNIQFLYANSTARVSYMQMHHSVNHVLLLTSGNELG